MKFVNICIIVIFLSTLFTLPGTANPAADTNKYIEIKCSVTREIKLSMNRGVAYFSNTTSSLPICYKVYIPTDTRFVSLDFSTVKGRFNLYRKEKLQSTFTFEDIVNRDYVFYKPDVVVIPYPAPGWHTLLVEPLVDKATSFSLSLSLARAMTTALNLPNNCGEACRGIETVKKVALVIEKDATLTLPFTALGPGTITAIVFSDPHTTLTLRLRTPDRPGWYGVYGKDNFGVFDSLSYTITAGNFRNEQHWELKITNRIKRTALSIVLLYPGYMRLATREDNTDRLGEDYDHRELNQANPEICRQMCVDDRRCVAYTYVRPIGNSKAICHLKENISQPSPNKDCTSGVIVVRQLTFEPGVDITGASTDYKDYNLSRADPSICSADCAKDPRCQAFAYLGPTGGNTLAHCWLKEGVPPTLSDEEVISGRTLFRTAVLEQNKDRYGGDYASFPLNDPYPSVCRAYCQEDPNCAAFTFVKPGMQGDKAMCHLKNIVPSASSKTGCVSGVIRTSNLTMEYDADRPHASYSKLTLSKAHPESCRIQCALDPRCKSYSYKKPNMEWQGSPPFCYLNSSIPATYKDTCCVSGVVK